MAPRTRSATKSSPGRLTRNSVYGRPAASPPKPRRNPTKNSQPKTPQTDDKVTFDIDDTEGTPWLACRDAYGIVTSIAMSETGEGIHIRWYYPEDDCEVDEDEAEDADVQMAVDEERSVTPSATAGPNNVVPPPFPQTPIALHSFDAGSVVRTPVKRAKPLQRSPPRIGDKGVRCLYEKGGILKELDGRVRVVLRHPIGSSANLTREQVEHLEDEREEKIVLAQVKRLLEEKRRLEEEEAQNSDSEDGGEMETDGTNSESSDIAAPSFEEMESALGFYRGPNGELLNEDGQQLLGREGTILMDSSLSGFRRARFGPQGTELID